MQREAPAYRLFSDRVVLCAGSVGLQEVRSLEASVGTMERRLAAFEALPPVRIGALNTTLQYTALH